MILIFLTLRNAAPSRLQVRAVAVQGSDVEFRDNRLKDLQPGRAVVLRYELASASPALVIRVFYNENGTAFEHSKVAVVRRSSSVSPSRFTELAVVGSLGGVFGLMGVLTGGWLNHRWTRRRERERGALEWRQLVFQQYEAAFRRFLSAWEPSVNADALRSHFERLRQEALVPDYLEGQYREVVKALASPASREEKLAAAGRLREHIKAYAYRPG